MWDLSRHEAIEIATLEGLNSAKVLQDLVFCGGTMLRLCYGLNRYSVDLDFWFLDAGKKGEIFDKIKAALGEKARLKKSENRAGSLYFEFAAKGHPRSLKLEVREPGKRPAHEEKIAYSKHAVSQVLVKAATLDEMMRAKIETFLFRAAIRDAFDIEFLMKKGVKAEASAKELDGIRGLVEKFKPDDYKTTLGSLLDFSERAYYRTANFRILLNHINSVIGEGRNGKKDSTGVSPGNFTIKKRDREQWQERSL